MKVLALMSGGVDSSLAAARLVADGHEVVGATVLLWGGARRGRSCSTADESAAQTAADAIGIPLIVLDRRDDFNTQVVKPHVDLALQGVTTNPCVSCNKQFKLDMPIEYARAHGYDAVATGHYARIVNTPEGPRLGRAVDESKDQSYFLWEATPDQLSMLMFPLGDNTKDITRIDAAALDLPAAADPDSMDLCFDPHAGAAATRDNWTAVTLTGKSIGTVPAGTVTIGQRRGIPKPSGVGEATFVTDISPDENGVVHVKIGTRKDLESATVTIGAPTFYTDTTTVFARSSSSGAFHPATITRNVDGTATVTWTDGPRSRVAPGQHVVCYDPTNYTVIGGGTSI